MEFPDIGKFVLSPSVCVKQYNATLPRANREGKGYTGKVHVC